MRLVSLAMLADAVEALCAGDRDLAADVIERDDDVDRLWYMTSRVFRGALRNPDAATDIGLSRETCFDYHMSARQLERIADHATKIAEIVADLDKISDEIAEALISLHDSVENIIETAMDALLADDDALRMANDVMSSIGGIDKHIQTVDNLLRDYDSERAQRLRLVIDSLSRCADYGGNIAETAMQKAAPQP